jgi:hypothetical protein
MVVGQGEGEGEGEGGGRRAVETGKDLCFPSENIFALIIPLHPLTERCLHHASCNTRHTETQTKTGDIV